MKTNIIELVDEVCTNKPNKHESHRLTIYRFMAQTSREDIIKTHLMNLVETFGPKAVKESINSFQGIKTKRSKSKKVA